MIVFIYLVIILLIVGGVWISTNFKNTLVGKVGRFVFSISFFLLLFELGSLLVLYVFSGNSIYFRKVNQNEELFEPHPYMVGMNRRNIRKHFNGYTFSHNSLGFRGEEVGEKKAGVLRIAVIGGSTTYGVGVNNWETWAHYLDSLSANYEVINMGVPGHSTVEHIAMASFILPELEADVVLIHAGLNDLRNSHVTQLLSDYSNFHAPTIAGSLGFCPREKLPNLAAVWTTVRLLQELNLYPTCEVHRATYEGVHSGDIDKRVLQLYQRNLNTMIAIIQQHSSKIVLLPQVLSAENFFDNNYQWWAPYLPDSAIFSTVHAFNQTMKQVAIENEVMYADSLEISNWNVNEFSDPSHLNRDGNLKFASIVYSLLLKNEIIGE